jgi:hypothetical protein
MKEGALKFALYIAALVLGLASATTLRAQPVMQPFYPGFAGLPPYEIVALVRSAGLDPVSRPVRQGPVYVLRALSPAGQEVRVVVDARMGRIVKVAAVAPTDPGAFAPPESIPSARPVPDTNAPGSRIATMPPGSDDDFEPVRPGAPAVVPRPPARTAAKPPPLPRPRPKEAVIAAPKEADDGAPAAAATAAAAAAPGIVQSPASTGPSASAENTAPSSTEIDE